MLRLVFKNLCGFPRLRTRAGSAFNSYLARLPLSAYLTDLTDLTHVTQLRFGNLR